MYGNLNGVLMDGVTVDNVVADHVDGTDRIARGIRISPSGSDPIATNVTIQNSSLSNVGPKDDGDCVVIQGSDQAANLTVSGNSFYACAKRAIKIQVPGAVVSNNTIVNPFDGNNFTDPSVASYTAPAFPYDMFAAISVHASNVTVQNDNISGVGSFYIGIDIGASCSALTGITVTGNTMAPGLSSYAVTDSDIRMLSPATVSITNNTLSNATYGITIYPGTSPTLSGNTFNNIPSWRQTQTYGACS